ncbi:E3 ubiquitin-protein ligase ZNRF3 [Merluccius polli]|uniref:RING-type E3 ubiquitin transferase n=1 Tax=Merluccius polli TaxID=89951 RepID=A0AA47MPF6_MERPO|nr:E3 ubiquitin-protein ligase ZNRF3 [Merluccius polli]
MLDLTLRTRVETEVFKRPRQQNNSLYPWMKGNLILGHYQAKRAVQRGATAVIFDVSENPDAIDQSGWIGRDRTHNAEGQGGPGFRTHNAEGQGGPGFRTHNAEGQGGPGFRTHNAEGQGGHGFRTHNAEGQGGPWFRNHNAEGQGGPGFRNHNAEVQGGPGFRTHNAEGRGSPGFRTHNAKGQGGPAAKMSFLEFTTGSVSTALSCEQLNQVGEDPLKRPVVYVKGNDAMKLMNIVNKQKVARARIQHRPPRQPTEYFDMGIFLAFFVVVSLVCLILLIKIKLKQRRSQSSLNRMAIQALEKMETRKFKAKVKGERESSCGVSDWLSSSSTSDCAICLEKYTDGEVRRTFYTKAHFNAPSNLIGRMDPHFVCRHCP